MKTDTVSLIYAVVLEHVSKNREDKIKYFIFLSDIVRFLS